MFYYFLSCFNYFQGHCSLGLPPGDGAQFTEDGPWRNCLPFAVTKGFHSLSGGGRFKKAAIAEVCLSSSLMASSSLNCACCACFLLCCPCEMSHFSWVSNLVVALIRKRCPSTKIRGLGLISPPSPTLYPVVNHLCTAPQQHSKTKAADRNFEGVSLSYT